MLQYFHKTVPRLYGEWIFLASSIFATQLFFSCVVFLLLSEVVSLNQTFMKERKILPLVLSMSLPMVISMTVNSLYNIVDSFFVAKISEDAMTALSLVYPVQNLVNAVTIGFAIGINAVIAFYLGAKQEQNASAAATQGIILNFLHGILLTIGCIAVMPSFLRMFTSDQTVLQLGLRYANIVLLFSVVISMAVSFEKIFQSVGKMKVSMFSMMVGCVSNILLDPILIFGLGPAPKLGIEGAAIATGIGQVLSLAVYLLIYLFRPLGVRIQLHGFSLNKSLAVRLYAIGIPAALNMALPSVLISALNGILAVYGQAYVLVLGVYYKLQTFLYLSANGIIQGIRPLVGYNYGAKEYRRVHRIYRTSLTLIASIMAVGMVLCLLFPQNLMELFTTNAQTLDIGAEALRIISLGFVVSAVSVTASGTLEGLSQGMPSLVISLCRYIIVIIPAALVLSHILGAVGVWYAFSVSELLTALATVLIYRAVSRRCLKI